MAFDPFRALRFNFGRPLLAFLLVAGLALPAGSQTVPAQTVPVPGVPAPAELRRMIATGHAAEALAALDREAAAGSSGRVVAGAGLDRGTVQDLRGSALYTLGRLQEADQAFAAALQANPADREAGQMRGLTLFRLGRPAAAIPLLEAARKAQKDVAANTPVDPLYVLALCYLDTRRYDDARGAFAAQFGFAPDSAGAYLLAARMLLRREYVPVAQEFARKALALEPGLPRAHLLLGETELAGNHLEEAARELAAERALNPLEPAVYDRLGDTYVRQGNLEQARLVLQEAVLLEPNSTGPFILLGKVLLKQGDPAGAATYLERARGMDPGNAMTHSLLSQSYRQMGRTEDARRETETQGKIQAASEPKLVQQP